jgi:hypothetical protein
MRKGIIVNVTAADGARLRAVVASQNSPQKHVSRASIILLTVAVVRAYPLLTLLALPARRSPMAILTAISSMWHRSAARWGFSPGTARAGPLIVLSSG